jgi:hypothetical protein
MPRLVLPVLIAQAWLFLPASAQEAAPAAAAEQPAANNNHAPRSLLSRIQGLFDIDLPQLDPPGTFHLQFNPRSGDLFHRAYLRVPTGVRWAVNDSLELSTEADAYVTHGFRGSAGYGIGEIQAGVRYVSPALLSPEFRTSLGFNVARPVGSPPIDMTDGLNHYTPSIVVERQSRTYPRLSAFGGYSLDFVTCSTVHGIIGENTPHDDSMAFTGGVIYDMGQIKWTLQSTYTTTAVLSSPTVHIFSVQPSFLWFVPKRYTFHSKTQWILGLGVRSVWGPDGFRFSSNSRVRADITFGQVVNGIRNKLNGQHGTSR